MPFLVLTRAGLDDLGPRARLPGTLLYLNPQLLSAGEIALLENAGARVRILPAAVDAHDEAAVRAAAALVGEQGGGPVWVENTSAAAMQPGLPAHEQAPQEARESARGRMLRLAEEASGLAARTLRRIKGLTTPGRPLLIIPFLGYGDTHRLRLRGRVLEDEGFGRQSSEDSAWNNLVELYKRLESDQVAGALVRARFQGKEQETLTDRGGYFSFEIALPQPLSTPGWHAIELELLDPLPAGGAPVRATAQALVPPPQARFGVISDIDDTILWTNVTNKLNMLLMLARSNAHTRKPFKGVAAFYRALRDGAVGSEDNPVFYVSSSPWHLFPPLLEFLRLQDLPVGPLLLRELGVRKLLGAERRHHKLEQIESILEFYPRLQFILIGDSGEQDPEIYAEVVRRHPAAVRVIYIRSVNPDPARIEALDLLIEQVRSSGAQLVLAPDSEYAAAHAAAAGLIQPSGMAAVRSEKREDEAGALPGEGANG